MAKRLTEEMVIARTKISDLSKIKRLNCWGSELVDVSLLRKMPSVEVLSLSINNINSLVDFQFCKRLEELYIRQNDIRDLNEIMYLQSLTNLKNLWLGENPCANIEGYRLAVIRALPQLQKLDNVAISQEEMREAQRRGKILVHPDDETQEESEEEYQSSPTQAAVQQQPQYNRYQEYSEQEYSPPQRSPQRQEVTEYTNGERYVSSSHGGSTEITQPQEKRDKFTCAAATHRPPFTRRPVTRVSLFSITRVQIRLKLKTYRFCEGEKSNKVL
nr:unnamed protein product [Callosobruchus analis]